MPEQQSRFRPVGHMYSTDWCNAAYPGVLLLVAVTNLRALGKHSSSLYFL